MKLNTIQKQAINLIDNPCLILAGAGSGKTSVVIHKIIALILKYSYQPNKIFTVTFTNKAVQEIKYRLLKFLNIQQVKELNISTFHAFGLKIIQKEYLKLGIKKNFSIINESEQCKILKTIINIKSINNVLSLKNIIHKISFWKNQLFKPDHLKNNKKYIEDQKFIQLYEKYTIFLKKNSILDFNDLIFLPVLLFKKDEYTLNYWKKRVHYLLIDEYQDTNNMQYQLIKLICKNNAKFTLVGDDDQSIYSWRGAQPKNFLYLKHDFPDIKVIKMEQNYRSSKCILHVANQLISNNPNFFNKKLFSTKEYGEKIHLFINFNEFSEAKEIVRYIKKHKIKYNTKYKDYAILYRSNYQSKSIETELIYQKIPYHVYEGTSFLEKSEIKILLAYLRLIVNHDDDIAFLYIINTPNRRIGVTTIEKIKLVATKYNLSFFNIINTSMMRSILNKNTTLILKKFFFWIKNLSLLCLKNEKKILDILIKDINYLIWIKKDTKDIFSTNNRLKNIRFFITLFKNMLQGNDLYSPMSLTDILLHLTCGNYNNSISKTHNFNTDVLHLMTIHAAKGLEFSVVCIIGMEEGTFPHQKSILEDNIDEERRLMYVGITRAKTQLCLSSCRTKCKFGVVSLLKPSRFLLELPKNAIFQHYFYSKD